MGPVRYKRGELIPQVRGFMSKKRLMICNDEDSMHTRCIFSI